MFFLEFGLINGKYSELWKKSHFPLEKISEILPRCAKWTFHLESISLSRLFPHFWKVESGKIRRVLAHRNCHLVRPRRSKKVVICSNTCPTMAKSAPLASNPQCAQPNNCRCCSILQQPKAFVLVFMCYPPSRTTRSRVESTIDSVFNGALHGAWYDTDCANNICYHRHLVDGMKLAISIIRHC